MIKALFKKQLAEVFSFLFMDSKRKTRRTGKSLVVYLLVYGALIAYLCGFFAVIAKHLCEALVPMGLTWFYFAIVGLIALVLGVFGSVFNTYASLYLAKDNDMLLAMPILPRYILFVRLVGVYFSGLFFELIVMLPATVVFFIYGAPTVLGAVFAVLIPFVLSFFVLTLSCLLGLLVAAISVRVKRKSLVITVISLSFLGLYMWGYTKIMSSLTELLAAAGDIAERVKGPLFPFYHMGLAAEGKPVSMLIFSGIALGAFVVSFLLLARSFLVVATTNRGGVKKAYKRGNATQKSVAKALLVKEWKRFLASPTYILNCALGALFLPVAGVALLFFREDVMAFLPAFAGLLGDEDMLSLLLAGVACMMCTMIDVTAPSVSLEGKNLWIVRSLPVTAQQALYAKLALHLLIAIPPAVVALPCLLIAFQPSWPFVILIPLVTLLFILLEALVGLFMNLKAPNFTWTSEMVPVKQSLSVTVTLLGSMGAVFALGGLYVLLREHIAPVLYLLLVCVFLACACAGLFYWLRKRGAEIFASL